LFAPSELAQLSPSVLKAFQSSIITMTFDKQTARIILQKIFNVTFASTISLNTLGNLIIGLDSSTLNDVPNSEVKLNLNLILNSVDYADPFFKEILIRKVKN